MSLCGEHLSVDNMNQAVKMAGEQLGIGIKEFTVAGVPEDNLFAHHWYVGTEDQADAEALKARIDENIKNSMMIMQWNGSML